MPLYLKLLIMKYLFILPLFFSLSLVAQTIIKPDANIQQMTDEVSSKNVEVIIRKLVSFKTRHTLSDTTSKTIGSGAARNWIKAEYEKYAAESQGRMTVKFDTFAQPKGTRVDKPVQLKNVLAVLKGTDTKDTRVYIVSGHYDSRITDVMDPNGDEPGAND
ncbi:MAG: peptidase, partial [Mucilaginibacter sp.]|nr:peptidase [Mucilaginibacter sp.]